MTFLKIPEKFARPQIVNKIDPVSIIKGSINAQQNGAKRRSKSQHIWRGNNT